MLGAFLGFLFGFSIIGVICWVLGCVFSVVLFLCVSEFTPLEEIKKKKNLENCMMCFVFLILIPMLKHYLVTSVCKEVLNNMDCTGVVG